MSASVFQLLQQVTALFQAGGGGDFGGSDFGGSDFGALLSWLLEHPWVSVPLILLVGYLILRTYAEGERRVITRTIRKGGKVQQESLLTRAMDRIRETDAHFLQPVFLKRVTLAFRAIQECWSEQDLRKCRAFISDGVHE